MFILQTVLLCNNYSDAVATSGVLFVKRRVGHLPYEDDKDVRLL